MYKVKHCPKLNLTEIIPGNIMVGKYYYEQEKKYEFLRIKILGPHKEEVITSKSGSKSRSNARPRLASDLDSSSSGYQMQESKSKKSKKSNFQTNYFWVQYIDISLEPEKLHFNKIFWLPGKFREIPAISMNCIFRDGQIGLERLYRYKTIGLRIVGERRVRKGQDRCFVVELGTGKK